MLFATEMAATPSSSPGSLQSAVMELDGALVEEALPVAEAVGEVEEPQEVLVLEAVGEGAAEPVEEPLDVTVALALPLDEPGGEGDPVKEPQEVLVLEAVGEDDAEPVEEPLDVTVALALPLDEPEDEDDPVEEPQEVLVLEDTPVDRPPGASSDAITAPPKRRAGTTAKEKEDAPGVRTVVLTPVDAVEPTSKEASSASSGSGPKSSGGVTLPAPCGAKATE
jgi:hypothetical protein